ncbi:hypothetical protein [Bacillus sp. FJAT-26390]|uniref:hypothetical protein n=1 Tax=Bacillus sp. FJAT-26390 TaxID=1743142 RepID=UPI000807A2A4|nr:hypothetical protein [Bacillus sp. FJAT-26390]OBZ10969.1 hypothetical protein A7975_18435 [Bacillus sp. FJAT-26390]
MNYTYANGQQPLAAPRQSARAGSRGCGCGGTRMIMPTPSQGGFGPGGPGGFPPGPGPFPPGPGPFPPGPFPFPIPFPVPFPFNPGPHASVTVVINGGRAFPNVTQAYRVPFRPGLSIYQALAETGVVRFNFNGQIVSVSGIPISGNISYRLLLNGRIIPATLLSFPVQRNDSIALELVYNGLLREEDNEAEWPDQSDESIPSEEI